MNRRGFLSRLAAALLYPFQSHSMPYPESAHPYGINLDDTQTFVQPGSPARIVVYFDAACALEDGYDFVYLYDAADNPVGNPAGYTGAELAGLIIAVWGDTIKVRITSDSDIGDYGYTVTNVATADSTVALACVHIYQGPDSYLSERDADGNWSEGTIFDNASLGMSGVSPGYRMPEYPGRLGIVGYNSANTRAYWIGNGLPDAPIPFTGVNGNPWYSSYWDASIGGWWINDAWYALLPFTGGGGRLGMLKSATYAGDDLDRPDSWTEMDSGNSPYFSTNAQIRWDGTSRIVDVFTQVSGDTSRYCLYSYNLDTDEWSAAYGEEEFGELLTVSLHGDCGNGIFRYPNGDIGVLYGIGDTVYYRLYVRATDSWSAAVTVKDHGGGVDYSGRFCTMIPDPAKESLHVFTINKDTGYGAAYHVVPHTDSPVTDAYVWNTLTPDAFGNGTIYNGQIAVPFDDYDDNMIWFAPITGGATTFTAEILPRPISQYGTRDTGTPSCASLFYMPTPVASGSGNFAYFGSPSFGISKSTSGHGWFT